MLQNKISIETARHNLQITYFHIIQNTSTTNMME